MDNSAYFLFRKILTSRKFLIIIVLLVTVAVLFNSLRFSAKENISQAAFPESTQYQRIIQIDNTSNGSSLSNFQILLTLDTESLINASKMQADCDDIRLLDSDNSTELSYWIEEGNAYACDNSTTRIWVKVPNINANSTKTIYLYYGDSGLTAASNGANTFDFFDNFSIFNSSVWTATGAYTVSNGRLNVTTGSVYTTNTVGSQPNTITESLIRWDEFTSDFGGFYIADTTNTAAGNATSAALLYIHNKAFSSPYTTIYSPAADGNDASYNINLGTDSMFVATASTNYLLSSLITPTDFYTYNDLSEVTNYSGTFSGPYYIWFGHYSGSNAGTTAISNVSVDWVRTRKYSAITPSVTVGSERTESTSDFSIRFYGTGSGGIDRIRIPLLSPSNRAVNIGSDMTIEFWLKASLADNPDPDTCTTANDSWTNGHVIIDRDIFGDGDFGDYGISLMTGKIAFGVNNGTIGATVCGSTDVADNSWHHIAVVRSNTGQMRIYVDGTLDGTNNSSVTGDISYNPDRITNMAYPMDPYLIFGAEKHDYDPAYPSYSGFLDSVRFSDIVRYSSNFTAPTAPHSVDSNTVGLYQFNEGPSGNCATSTEIFDSSGAENGPSNGECRFGGSPDDGPEFSTDTPFSATVTTPDAPTSLNAISGNSQVSLSWTAPGSDGGASITDYVVEYRTGGGSYSVFSDGTSTNTNATVTGLTNGTTYEFRVAAVNSEGTGGYSGTAISTPATVPGQPTSLSATAGNTTVALSWSAPASNGGASISDYIVQYRLSGGGGSYTTFNDGTSTNTNATVTGLLNDSTYEFQVAAVNSVGTGSYSTSISATPEAGTTYINHILLAGQSLATGYDGTPALSITQPFSNVKMNGGMDAYIDLVEDYDRPDDNVSGEVESPASALANTITNLTSGNNYIVAISNNAVPGVPYSSLSKGTSPYNDGITQITNSRSIALSGGYLFRVPAVALIHGPANFADGAGYEAMLDEWQSDYETDITAVTNQSEDIPMFIDQSSNFTAYNYSSSELVQAQYLAAKTNDKIYLIGPRYQFTYAGDNIHLPNTGYRWLGEYYGKAIRNYLDGNPTALTPDQIVRNGNKVSIKFEVPVPPIIIDTSSLLAKTDYGFEYVDDSTSASISSVVVDGQDTIRITLSETPTGTNQKIQYAFTGTSGARPGADSSGSARGNIRDSDATESLYGNDLYNWLVHFREDITLDQTAPTVSSFSSSASSSTSITSSWTTNEDSSTYLQYGIGAVSEAETSETNTYPRVTSHSAFVSGLLPCTQYKVRAKSEDLAENLGYSSETNVTTSGCTASSSITSTVTSSQITAGAGGDVSFSNSGVELDLSIPSSFSGSNDAYFQIHQLDEGTVILTTSTPSGYIQIPDRIFELKALIDADTAITSFDNPITITINYSDGDVTNIEETSLRIFRWNGSIWNQLSNCSVDVNANTVSCETTSFSTFGLFGETQSGGDPDPTPTPSPSETDSDDSESRASYSCDVPDKPTFKNATSLNENSIKLLFNNPDDDYEGFDIRYGTEPGTYTTTERDVAKKGEFEYVVNNLSPGTLYYFQIRTTKDCGDSKYSSVMSASTKSKFYESFVTPSYASTEIKNGKTEPENIIKPTPTTSPQPSSDNQSNITGSNGGPLVKESNEEQGNDTKNESIEVDPINAEVFEPSKTGIIDLLIRYWYFIAGVVLFGALALAIIYVIRRKN